MNEDEQEAVDTKTCPACKRLPGEMCVYKLYGPLTGQTMSIPHSSRTKLVTAEKY